MKEWLEGMPKYITHCITIANMLFVTCYQYEHMLSLGGENMKALKDHKGVQLLSTVVDLQLCQYTGCDPAPLLQTTNELLLGDT